MTENWRDISGYEGKYQVSDLGNIRSLDRVDNYGRSIKGTLISQRHQKDGYRCVNLSSDGRKKTFRVHRLVAEAFCDNPHEFAEVNHIDENKDNNAADNLEWCSRSYNNSYGGGLRKRMSKYSTPCAQIKDGEVIAEFPSIIEASRSTGIPMRSIQSYFSGFRKHTHGFQWVKL